MKPQVENAPGLIWRERMGGWVAYWGCRTDLVARGYHPKTVRLWTGQFPTEQDATILREQCQRLQSEMLLWARGLEAPITSHFDGTLRGLINAYQTDKDSTFHKLRYHVRVRHTQMLKRMVAKHGHEELANIKGRLILAWHQEWMGDGKVAVAHMFAAELRTLFGFGMTMLENAECERLSGIMSKMRFPTPAPRTERLTADQATAIRHKAHELGAHSIAIGQAFQFDLMLRQKDAIGEFVPQSEKVLGETVPSRPGKKWRQGLRWQEIDQNLILTHVTSKRGKPLEVNLRKAPMVMEELARIAGVSPANLTRDLLPTEGPIIIREATGIPWFPGEYRNHWRKLARAVGIPDSVKNMDSRAGGITEATEAGADLEHVRHAATHSNISMTQRYSRGAAEKIGNVMDLRAAHRNKKRTDEA